MKKERLWIIKYRLKVYRLCLSMIFFCFALYLTAAPAAALELRGEIAYELETQSLKETSAFNPDNLHQLNELQYVMRGNLVLKSDLAETASGFVKLEWVYAPVTFKSAPGREVEQIYVKEIYLDLWSAPLTWRIGKYPLKWGGTVFFNPIDLFTGERDPRQPVEAAEGIPLINVTYPVNEQLSLDLVGKIEEKKTTGLGEIPVAARLAFSHQLLSGFTFFQCRKAQKPVYGLDLEYVYTINDELSGSVYGVASYKTESTRQKIMQTGTGYELQKYEAGPFAAFVLGATLHQSLSHYKRLAGVSLTAEYYHDAENWSRQDFRNYIDCLKLSKSNPGAHASAPALYEDFRNARHYLYLALDLHGFLTDDLELGFDTVTNLEDGSRVYLPNLSYFFNNNNSVCRLGAKIYRGDSVSEFGNHVAGHQLSLSLQTAL